MPTPKTVKLYHPSRSQTRPQTTPFISGIGFLSTPSDCKAGRRKQLCRMLSLLLFHTPRDCERIRAFAGTDESAPF